MAERTSEADQGNGQEDQQLSASGDQPSDTRAIGESQIDLVEDQKNPTQVADESECPGCQSPEALTLPCGHKLCPTCIELCQGEMGQDGCTVCYGSQLMDSVLQTLLEALFKGQPRRQGVAPRSEDEEGDRGATDEDKAIDEHSDSGKEELCEQHGEPLSAFCMEDEELLCPDCQDCQAERHEDHQCFSIEEAVLVCKQQLRSTIRSLQEQLVNITSIRQMWEETAAHITSQSVMTTQVLREEFEKMHQYLRDEEASLMSQLKQEEEEKSQRMEEKISKIGHDIQMLTNSIRETEEVMALDEVPFLKNYKKASERADCRVEEPEDESETLLDVAQHQGCVQHRVWDKMLRIIQYFPVTMDPNTGAAGLGVSPDLSSVFVCEAQSLPENPERFVSPQSILGSEGFDTGRHSWEVEVGDNSHWSLGVASEGVSRKDWSRSDQDQGPRGDADPGGDMWTVSLSSGEYRAHPGRSSPLTLRRRPRRVRVQLDWERGCLTFSDASDNTLIYRFKKQWSGTLKPYFSTTCSKHPLKISAGRVSVVIE